MLGAGKGTRQSLSRGAYLSNELSIAGAFQAFRDASGARVVLDSLNRGRAQHFLVIDALPNGNSIECTMGGA